MIRFIGILPELMDQAYDEAEAFFAYTEDPEADLTTTLTVEERYGVEL